MKRIYFKDGEGKTVYVEVSDKVAETYMEVKREAWRNDSYEEYYRAICRKDCSEKHIGIRLVFEFDSSYLRGTFINGI